MREQSFSHNYRQKLPDDMKILDLDQYLLITEGGAITPWHVDFSGTSVFYFLLKGQKEFVVVPNSYRREFEQHKLGKKLEFKFCYVSPNFS